MEITQELRASLPCGSSFFVESDDLCHCRAEWHRDITQNFTTYVSNCSDVSPKSSHVGFVMSRWSVFFKNENCVELLSVTLAVNTTPPLVLDPVPPMSRDACGVVCAMSTLTKLSTFFLVFRFVSVRVASDELVSHLRDFPQSVFAYCFSFLCSSFVPILVSMCLSFVLRSSFCLGLQEQRALLNPSVCHDFSRVTNCNLSVPKNELVKLQSWDREIDLQLHLPFSGILTGTDTNRTRLEAVDVPSRTTKRNDEIKIRSERAASVCNWSKGWISHNDKQKNPKRSAVTGSLMSLKILAKRKH